MFYKILIRIIRVIDFIFYGFKKPDNSIIPEDEGLIVCCNHPGLRDPVFIAESIDRQLTFMAKKELFKFKPFGKLISSLGAFPIDRENSDIAALKTAIRLLKDKRALLIFPQGTRCTGNPPETLPIKSGTGMMVYRTQSDVIPVSICI